MYINFYLIPGGYNALQRMYRDIQEPMLSATTEQLNRNPFASLVDNTSTNNPQQGTENREPLPNPWSGQTPPNPPATSPGRGVINNPPMTSLLQQISDNPQLIQNMLSAPYTQSMMEALAADPNMANSLLADNPLIANNPALQEQMRAMMPQFLQQMQNPEIHNLMTNPQALNAIMQIQQGMETLRQTAPSLVNTFVPPTTTASAAASTTAAPSVTTPTATSTAAPTTGTTSTLPATGGNGHRPVDQFSEVITLLYLTLQSSLEW